ncbi:MAG: C40 family peptidase [Saprospiraceae bacterium]|nr:C40 family peptidase [Saprospiraceae bacterium]
MLQFVICFFLLMPVTTSTNPTLEDANARMAVIKQAKQLLKTKYKYGGKNPKGFDCSGFTQYVYKSAIGINLGGSSKAQFKQGVTVSKKNAKPGDLIFFKRSGKINHVGIITKSDNNSIFVIHSTSSKGVIIEDVRKSSYWQSKISKIKRII